MIYWYIDTRSFDHVRLGVVESSGKTLAKRSIHSKRRITSGRLIRFLQALSDGHAPRGIIVRRGPGGFSAVRVGVVTANALGFSLGIPCVGLQSEGELASRNAIRKAVQALHEKRANVVIPIYGSEPSVTIPRAYE